MNKKILFLLILLGSTLFIIGKQTNEEEEKPQKQKDIEQLQYFLDNQYGEVADENGISYDLNVIKTIVDQEEMYVSNKMFVKEGDIGFDKYVVVSSYRIKVQFKLTTNGKTVNNIQLEGFLIKSQISGGVINGACNDSLTYYPEINTIEDRKNAIKEFTSAWCGFGIGDDVKNAKIEAIRSSGILADNPVK